MARLQVRGSDHAGGTPLFAPHWACRSMATHLRGVEEACTQGVADRIEATTLVRTFKQSQYAGRGGLVFEFAGL